MDNVKAFVDFFAGDASPLVSVDQVASLGIQAKLSFGLHFVNQAKGDPPFTPQDVVMSILKRIRNKDFSALDRSAWNI